MPGKIFVIAVLFVLYPAPSIFAQSATPLMKDSTRSSQAYTYIGVGGAVLLTAVMIQYDQQIYDDLYSWKMNNKIVKDVSSVITNLGDGYFSMGLFGGFAGYVLIFKDKKAVEVGKIGIESFLLTGVTVQLFKHLCGRERPSDATRPGGFWQTQPLPYYSDRLNRGINKELPNVKSSHVVLGIEHILDERIKIS